MDKILTAKKEDDMSDYNLPPGCKSSDIPGNRPEDEKYENWISELIGYLDAVGSTLQYDEIWDEMYADGLTPEEAADKLYCEYDEEDI
jgi:hypothetical protein